MRFTELIHELQTGDKLASQNTDNLNLKSDSVVRFRDIGLSHKKSSRVK